MRRPLLLAAVGLIVAALLAGTLLYRSARGSSHGVTSMRPRATSSLPVIWRADVTWPKQLRAAVDRGALRLRDLHGYPVVLNFFASWCGPCRREAALLRVAARRMRARIVFLGADVHDYAPDARRFLRGYHMPYAAVRSGSSTIEAFGLIGLPDTFYLDRRGRVVGVTRGELTAAALASGLRRLANR
jgi:cytochrome c biogenesis protein CcmG/thiol:disulfide interchange protein DsbE